MGKTITLIGVGSPVSGDQAGLEAIALLQHHAEPASANITLHWLVRERPGLSLLADWADADTVVLIDTLVTSLPTPPVQRIAPQTLLQQAAGFSSHDIGVAETVALAETLGQLPPQLLLYGIAAHHSGNHHVWLAELKQMLHEDLQDAISFQKENSAPETMCGRP